MRQLPGPRGRLRRRHDRARADRAALVPLQGPGGGRPRVPVECQQRHGGREPGRQHRHAADRRRAARRSQTRPRHRGDEGRRAQRHARREHPQHVEGPRPRRKAPDRDRAWPRRGEPACRLCPGASARDVRHRDDGRSVQRDARYRGSRCSQQHLQPGRRRDMDGRDPTPADNQAQALLQRMDGQHLRIVALSRLVRGLPSSGGCVRGRKLRLRLRRRSARSSPRADLLYVAGKRVRRVRGKALRRSVTLRRLPRSGSRCGLSRRCAVRQRRRPRAARGLQLHASS